MSEQVSNRRPIRHVVLFSSKHPDNIEPMINGLSMLAKIPTVSHFEVSRNRNEDHYSNEVDVIVYAEFEDAAALEAYRAHPIYQKCIEVVRPLRELRLAADF
ncbi:Dabb family protein [uncultured Tateyamaria sp.]|uniref:Dabb family protein n=1 Tax=uncultured Tateyamaria sp. TaxID=455651 RepID=UPI00262E71E5|nr:Dabb family protein [uncultured Tateyamaria sp.]